MKPGKKNWGLKSGPNGANLQTESEIRIFCHFLEVTSLVFLSDIAQDFRLGQYLTSSEAEASQKNFMAKFQPK